MRVLRLSPGWINLLLAGRPQVATAFWPLEGAAQKASAIKMPEAGGQFILEAATGLACGCSSIFSADSSALRKTVAACAVHRNRADDRNLTSVEPSGFGIRFDLLVPQLVAVFL